MAEQQPESGTPPRCWATAIGGVLLVALLNYDEVAAEKNEGKE